VAHELIKAGFSPRPTASLSPATIRNLIDNFGFAQVQHAEIASVQSPEAAVTVGGPMPGGFHFVAGPGTEGFDPIAPLMIPGGLPSTINWPALIRDGIDAVLGRNGGLSLQENAPIEGGLMRPGVGTSMVPSGGCLPQIGARSSGRAAFICMPNGMQGCPTGYHPEKSGKPYCVRNRRMNPLNPRALSRATRRVGGFARAVKRARTLKKICRTL